MSDMNQLQELALAQGLYNRLGAIVSTKDPDSMRAQMDERARMLYANDGIKSRDVQINGMKVATYTVKTAKAQPAIPPTFEDVLKCTGAVDEFADAIMSDPDVLRGFIMRHAETIGPLWMRDTGEVPPAFEMVEEMADAGMPAQPERVTGTVLRVDTDALAVALGPQLPSAVAGILTDGRS